MLRYLRDTHIVIYVFKRRPKLGQPIGVNDMHIAAHARSEGLVLVTNNMGEFARVPALEAENWAQTASG